MYYAVVLLIVNNHILKMLGYCWFFVC